MTPVGKSQAQTQAQTVPPKSIVAAATPPPAMRSRTLTRTPLRSVASSIFVLASYAALLVVTGVGSAAAAPSCYQSLSRADFPHCKLLAPGFALHWAVRGDTITLGLDADTGGYPDSWLALAFSDAGGMKGADMIVVAGPRISPRGAVGPSGANGGWRVIDAHSLDFEQPQADDSQDVTLLGTPLSGANHTVAVVTRKLRTCDPWDRHIAVGVPQTVSWAYGRRWPAKHVARGNSAVFFVPEADRLWGTANSTTATTAIANATAAATAKASAPAAIANHGTASAATTAGGAGAVDTAVTTASRTNSSGQSTPVATLFAASVPGSAPATGGGGAGRREDKAPIDTKADGTERDEDEDEEEDGDGDSGPLAASVGSAAADENLLELDVRMPNVTVPANRTTNYLCTHVKMPNDRKYHIVGERALVESPLVHHMILFACNRPPPPAQPPGVVYDCLEVAAGKDCFTFVIGWAPGQAGADYPPTVGLPIGLADSTYFGLQVHYNNPDGKAGVVDDSGFKLRYTPKLRPYDAAILTIGQQAIAIPPGRPDFTLAPNVCPSSCTSQLRAPLRLLSSGLHMHTLGRRIVTQHIRNGTELPPVGSKPFYDFDFQSADPVPLDSSLLLPGDVLITTCSYDSTSRTNVTLFGESTTDEMCFNFILYYPKNPNFSFCMSMDATGDPRVALCANNQAATEVGQVLKQLAKNATASANRQPPPTATNGAPPSGGRAPVNLTAVPALSEFFRKKLLVPVPAADKVYEPYGKDCPDMWYNPA